MVLRCLPALLLLPALAAGAGEALLVARWDEGRGARPVIESASAEWTVLAGGRMRIGWDRESLVLDWAGPLPVELSLRGPHPQSQAVRLGLGGEGPVWIESEPGRRTSASSPLLRWEPEAAHPPVAVRLPLAWSELLSAGWRPEPGELWTLRLEPPLHELAVARIQFEKPATPRPPWTVSRVAGSPDPAPPYRVERIYPQLQLVQPIYLKRIPGHRDWVVVTHAGGYSGPSDLLRLAAGGEAASAGPLLRLEAMVYCVAFHPRFAQNGRIFLLTNHGEGRRVLNQIREYRMDPDSLRIDAGSRRVLLEWESNGHNGGEIAFGSDGFLYASTGDGTSDSDTDLRGQNLGELTAAILRMDVDRPSGGLPYSIPEDNPFVGRPGARPEIWAFGLRNPWRMTFDRAGRTLWIGNNGQDLWEQVYLGARGANYGWSVFEGSHPFQLQRTLLDVPVVWPVLEHPHSEARSLTGGIVYSGGAFSELQDAYVYGDYSTGRIWAAKHRERRIVWHRELARTRLQIVAFAEGPDGEIAVLDHGGGIYRLVAAAGEPARRRPFPRRLSDTGLFADTRRLLPAPGVVPYTVNSPLWSDGAEKSRWIAIPGDGRARYHPESSWDFPEGTVLVKMFSFPSDSGPSRRIETRLLTRQAGEWAGYTYVWNQAQTDAVLLGPESRQSLVEHGRGRERGRTPWHFPSRTECMVCHSRAAQFVLGISEAQLNRPDPATGINQLSRLEALGLVEVPDLASLQQASSAASRLGPRSSSLLPRNPGRLSRLADPYDPAQPLEARARSYLHANCAHCHVEGGGGNSLLNLERRTALERMRLVDVAPQHDRFGIPEARLAAPGDPGRSVLLHRMRLRGPGQMPPLSTLRPDPDAVALLAEWILQLPSNL